MILEIHPQNPQPRLVQQVAEKLRQGAIICYPTDTVYGIGCDIFNQKALNRIYQIKKRPIHKPFSFMCSSLKDVSQYCYVSNFAYRLMKKCLPGPYTFILPAMKMIPKLLITKQKTVGIRVPNNAISLALEEALGNPILTTSAILDEDGVPPLADAFQIEERFPKNVFDIIIDGGLIYPEPSTVISLVDDEPLILRTGKGSIALFTQVE